MSLFGTAFIPSPISNEPGRGVRATGGWVSDRTLKRRVRLSVFFAPSVAKCLSLFKSTVLPWFFLIFSLDKQLYILLYEDMTCLCLNRPLLQIVKFLSNSPLAIEDSSHLQSY